MQRCLHRGPAPPTYRAPTPQPNPNSGLLTKSSLFPKRYCACARITRVRIRRPGPGRRIFCRRPGPPIGLRHTGPPSGTFLKLDNAGLPEVTTTSRTGACSELPCGVFTSSRTGITKLPDGILLTPVRKLSELP